MDGLIKIHYRYIQSESLPYKFREDEEIFEPDQIGEVEFSNKIYIIRLPLFTNLLTLTISRCRIKSLDNFPDMPTLCHLSIINCNLKTVKNFPDCPRLLTLSLNNNMLKSITGLSKLKRLQKLYLYGNSVKTLRNACDTQYLHTLDIRNNKFKKLKYFSPSRYRLEILRIDGQELKYIAGFASYMVWDIARDFPNSFSIKNPKSLDPLSKLALKDIPYQDDKVALRRYYQRCQKCLQVKVVYKKYIGRCSSYSPYVIRKSLVFKCYFCWDCCLSRLLN